jgi:hypothetical protein
VLTVATEASTARNKRQSYQEHCVKRSKRVGPTDLHLLEHHTISPSNAKLMYAQSHEMLQQSTGSSHVFTVYVVITVANKRQSRETMFRIYSSSCTRSIISRNSFNNNNNPNPYVNKTKKFQKQAQDMFPRINSLQGITLLCIFPARLGIQANSILSSRNRASRRIMETSPAKGK